MWRSEQAQNRYGSSSNNSGNNRAPSSSSSSRSLASSTLPPSATKKRTIEEVWKDVSLFRHFIPPHNQQLQGRGPATFPSLRTMILQDFLAWPLNRAPAPATDEDLPPPPSAAPPITALSLSPSPEIRLSPADAARANSNSYHSAAASISPAFSDTLPSPPSPIGLLSFYSRKIMPDNPPDSGDRRYKRMIKNRESAARSRSRKQAYINELEQEVTQLLKENSNLKKELEELRVTMAAKHLRRNSLRRSSSSPY